MDKFLVLVISFFVFTSPARSQKLTESQEAVQQTVISLFEALSNRDTALAKASCTADIILYENGMVWNLDTLIQAIKMNQAKDFKRINSIDFINTTVDKNIAWATYNNQAEVTKNGKHVFIKWMETVILIREDKKWKIKVLHSTLIKRS